MHKSVQGHHLQHPHTSKGLSLLLIPWEHARSVKANRIAKELREQGMKGEAHKEGTGELPTALFCWTFSIFSPKIPERMVHAKPPGAHTGLFSECQQEHRTQKIWEILGKQTNQKTLHFQPSNYLTLEISLYMPPQHGHSTAGKSVLHVIQLLILPTIHLKRTIMKGILSPPSSELLLCGLMGRVWQLLCLQQAQGTTLAYTIHLF